MGQIAPKGFQPLDGTAPRTAILGDQIALKGRFQGAQRIARRPWAIPFAGRGVHCHFEVKPGEYCEAYHTKESEFCVGHQRAIAKANGEQGVVSAEEQSAVEGDD